MDGEIFTVREKMIDSLPLPVIQYYGAMGCRQVVRHETLTLALRWFDPSHPSQKSESSAFGFFIYAVQHYLILLPPEML